MVILQDIVELMDSSHPVYVYEAQDKVIERKLFDGQVGDLILGDLLSRHVLSLACKRNEFGYILNIKVEAKQK